MNIIYNVLIDEFKDKAVKDEKIKLTSKTNREVYRIISNISPHFDVSGSICFHLPFNRTSPKIYVELDYYFPDTFDLEFYSKLCFYFGKISLKTLLIDLLLIDRNSRVRYIQNIPILSKKLILDILKSHPKDVSLKYDASQTMYIILKIYESSGDQAEFSLRWINATSGEAI